LHAGDVLAGWKIYAGQEFELSCIGYAEQKKRFLKFAEYTKGIDVYFITGNHDASMKKLAGVNVGEDLAEHCPNWHHVGEDYGDINLVTKNGRSYRVRLVHPDGGTAYAISYKAQRQAESLDGGNKPNMLILGHFHKAEHLPSYRNIDVIQAGTWEWQTPFMARKGSAAHVGGWITRVTVGDKGSMSNSVQAEFMAFYRRS
jgi:UDP-2,3-diacylglucosamine pyrophosphatase LpxH